MSRSKSSARRRPISYPPGAEADDRHAEFGIKNAPQWKVLGEWRHVRESGPTRLRSWRFAVRRHDLRAVRGAGPNIDDIAPM
jgi:hypothetical protein